MKTEYQYITFKLASNPKHKTSTFNIRGKATGFALGQIKWHGPWRQYCFFPSAETVFNKGCLSDINHFIDQLMDARKGNPGS